MLAYLAVCFYIFSVPWQNAVILPGIGTVARGAAVVAFGLTALEILLRAKFRPLPPAMVIALAFLTWVGLSTFWAVALPEYINVKFGQYLQLLAVFWATWEVARSEKRANGLLLAYICGGYVAIVSTLVNYRAGVNYQASLAGMSTDNYRYAATGFDPNDLGATLALGMPIAWYLSITSSRSWIRWVARAYLPLGAVAIFLTSSRGALLATVVGLSIIPWTVGRIRWSVRIIAVVLVCVSAAMAITYVPANSWQRLGSTRTELERGTLNRRLVIWKAGMRALPQRPVHGFGPAGFHRAVEPILGLGVAPHNTFLAVLVEEGMIGLSLFLAMLAAVFLRLLPLPTREFRFELVLFATLVVAILPLGWENRKPLWLILSLLIAHAGAFSAARASLPSAPPTSPPLPLPRAPQPRSVPQYGSRLG